MTNILTAAEAASALRCDETDQYMLDLLPGVDSFIRNATGRDWTQDNPIHPVAKSAARMLIVQWHEDPGMQASGVANLNFGLRSTLVQLEALAAYYFSFAGRNGAGKIDLPGAQVGDQVNSVTGIVGVSGDQSAAFESEISVDDQIQQISTSDLSASRYRAYLVPLEDL